jgi:hypothetical protein
VQESQYHPSQEKILRGKKSRHRRSGSHGSSSLTPRDSPNRDRRAGGLCEAETQTELPPSFPYSAPHPADMQLSDASETDGGWEGPSPGRLTASTPRAASVSSLNGNSMAGAPPCHCPGCPGNPALPPLLLEQDRENMNLDQEDYLDTLDRKVNEIMNRDCSRRSSYHDLGKGKDEYGRNHTVSDLNSNPSPYSPRLGLGPAPEGTIRFEDDGKASSSEAIDSSREDLSQAWSEEDDSDQYVLRRRSLARRPIRGAKGPSDRMSVLSLRSMPGPASSGEEGEASSYPASSSQRSTLDSTRGARGAGMREASSEDDLSQVQASLSQPSRLTSVNPPQRLSQGDNRDSPGSGETGRWSGALAARTRPCSPVPVATSAPRPRYLGTNQLETSSCESDQIVLPAVTET